MERTRYGWWCDQCWQFSDTEVCPNHTPEALAARTFRLIPEPQTDALGPEGTDDDADRTE